MANTKCGHPTVNTAVEQRRKGRSYLNDEQSCVGRCEQDGGGPKDTWADRGIETGWVGVEVDAERVALELKRASSFLVTYWQCQTFLNVCNVYDSDYISQSL